MTTLPITLAGSSFETSSVSSPAGLSIAGLANGDTVVAWQDGTSAALQLFNASGAAASSEYVAFTVGGGASLTNENVVGLANGNFVLTWNQIFVSGGNTFITVYAQLFDPNLNRVGNLITVFPQFEQATSGPGAFEDSGDVFATPDGGFAYAQSVNGQQYVQAYHADGSQNGTATPTQGGGNATAGATALTNGNYVILTFEIGAPYFFGIYDKSGNQIKGPTTVGPTVQGGNGIVATDIAALPDGQFVIVYTKNAAGSGVGTTTATIAAQIYNPDGSAFGNEIAVNDGALNNGFGVEVLGSPHVSTMPDGRFIVSWWDTAGDVNNNLTEVRVFNPDGTPATAVSGIPGSVPANARNDVTALSNTSFSVDWNTGTTIEGQVLSVPTPTTPAGTTAELILRETMGVNTSQLDTFDAGNNAILAGNPLGTLGLNWLLFGIGSFAGNPNEADLLMRDSNTGNLQCFDIASGQIGFAGVTGAFGSEWQPFGVGDFSGNANESDMVIHNTNTGGLDILDIQHNQLVNLSPLGGVGAEWQLLGAGDFSGNPGEIDLAIRDTITNAIDFVDIQHNHITALGPTGGSIGTEWQALGAGDFSSNANETDLLMRDSQNGQMFIFDMQHNQIVGAVALGGIGPEWQALGVGDFSGVPGEADLVMRDVQNGAINVFDIQHNQFVGGHQIGAIGVDWQNLGVGSPLVPGSPLA